MTDAWIHFDKLLGRKESAPAPAPKVCPECEGGGWVQRYSPDPPAFTECPVCFNPEGQPCP